MGHTRTITVSVAAIVILIAIEYAMHLDEERGKDEFVFDWGTGTTMEYRASGRYPEKGPEEENTISPETQARLDAYERAHSTDSGDA